MLRFLKINCREGLFDCGVGAYLLNPLKSEYTCDDLAKEYLNRMLPSAEEIFGSSKLPLFSQADQEKTAAWAGYRAYTAWAVLEPVHRALEEQGMERLYCEIELPLIFTLSDMEDVYKRQEWYRNKGYDFTITSSTAFDHKWIPGRNIFANVSGIVDEIFTSYLSRPNVRQPILTQY